MQRFMSAAVTSSSGRVGLPATVPGFVPSSAEQAVTQLVKESSRHVHISYKVSGKRLGIVWKRPHHEWANFVLALHYYAGRVCGVPAWCVHLLWKQDPWDEAQLPMNIYIECIVSNKFPEIDDDARNALWCIDTDDNRCCNCWEGCENLDDLGIDRTYNCEMCCPDELCDLCRVRLPGGRYRCLQCLVDLVQPPEDDDAYQARVEDALAFLSKAQQNRWRLVQY